MERCYPHLWWYFFSPSPYWSPINSINRDTFQCNEKPRANPQSKLLVLFLKGGNVQPHYFRGNTRYPVVYILSSNGRHNIYLYTTLAWGLAVFIAGIFAFWPLLFPALFFKVSSQFRLFVPIYICKWKTSLKNNFDLYLTFSNFRWHLCTAKYLHHFAATSDKSQLGRYVCFIEWTNIFTQRNVSADSIFVVNLISIYLCRDVWPVHTLLLKALCMDC